MRFQLRDAVALAAVFAIILLAWFPGVFVGRVINASDAMFQVAPWKAVAPAGWTAPANKLALDQVVQTLPWLSHERDSLRRGHLPLWNPWNDCGTAFLASQVTGTLSPFTFVALAFGNDATGHSVSILLRLMVAFAGAYTLARMLDVGRAGALLAAASFALSGPLLVWLTNAQTGSSVWLPWSLAAAESVVRAEGSARRKAAAALALVTAVHLFGSFPEASFHIAACTGAFGVLRLATLRGRRGMPWLGWFVAGLILGLALASVQVLPFIDAVGRSLTSAERIVRAQNGEAARLLPGVLPLAWAPRLYGTPMELNHETALAGNNFYETTLFAGVLPLILVPAFAWSLARNRALLALAVVGLAAIGLSFGPTAQVALWLARVPLVGLGLHQRLVLVWVLVLAILFGAAFDRLVEGRDPASRSVLVWVLLAGLAALAWGLVRSAAAGSLGSRAVASVAFAAALLLFGSAIALHRGRLGAGPCKIFLVVLTAVDLWLFGRGVVPTMNPADVLPETPLTRWLAQRPAPFRTLALGRNFPPNVNIVFRVASVQGYDALTSARYRTLWREALAATGESRPMKFEDLQAPEVLELLGVHYIIDDTGDPIPAALADLPVVHDGDARVYALPAPMPHAFVVHSWEHAGTAQEAGSKLRLGFDFRNGVLLEGSPRPAPDPARGADCVAFKSERPERLQVDVALAAAGVLVIMEGFDPGWKARIDGQPAEVLVAFGAFQAVAVPEGEHSVEMEFEPRGLRAGLGISLASLAIVLALALLPSRPITHPGRINLLDEGP